MNIRFNPLSAYRNTSSVSGKRGKYDVSADKGAVKTDKVTISAEGSDYAQTVKIQNDISAEVSEYGSADRLAAIKKQIADGSYGVSSKEIADRILERFA